MFVAADDLNARTQNFFREVNDRIAGVNAGLEHNAGDHGTSLIEVLCECGRQDCTYRLQITEDDYELLRSNPIGFVLVPGHDDKRVERVIRRTDRYVIVENKGRAAVIAREGDPRDRRPSLDA